MAEYDNLTKGITSVLSSLKQIIIGEASRLDWRMHLQFFCIHLAGTQSIIAYLNKLCRFM